MPDHRARQPLCQLREQLAQETSSCSATVERYDAEFRQLNETVSQLTEENTQLHERVLEGTEHRMTLMIEQADKVKAGKKQLEQAGAAAVEERARFTAQLERLEGEKAQIAEERDGAQRQAELALATQQASVEDLQSRAAELAQKVRQSNARSESQATLVSELEASARSSDNRCR